MKHLYIEVTRRCDLTCSHCSVAGNTGEPSEPSFSELVEAFSGFRDVGGEYLTLSGGEPGLRRDLPSLIDAARTLGFRITVFTNGRASSKTILEILRHADGRLALSVDGPTPLLHEIFRGPSTFEPVMIALRRAVHALGTENVMLSSVLSRPLLPEIARLWEFASQQGAGVLYLGVFEPIRQGLRHPLAPETDHLIEPIIRLLDLAGDRTGPRIVFSESDDLLQGRDVFSRRTADAAVGKTIKLQADGWALPGPFYYARQFRLGRPIEEGWASVMASPVLRFIRRQATHRVNETASCGNCFWRDRCAGGSLALTWATYGTWTKPCPLCRLYQATLDRAAAREVHRGLVAET